MEKKLILNGAGATDRGLVRSSNEDSYYKNSEHGIFIIADGMGGHSAGEVASSMMVKTARDILLKNIEMGYLERSKNESVKILIQETIKEANRRIYEIGKKNSDKTGMGTTAVVSLFIKKTVYIAWDGDSRAYLIRNLEIARLTDDHSTVHQLLASGMINEAEAAIHPFRNQLTRAVGLHSDIVVDQVKVKIAKNDIFLFCTDGVFDGITDGELFESIKRFDSPEKICTRLIDFARARGGVDNATVIAVKVEDCES